MIKILLLEKEVHERFIIQKNVSKIVTIIHANTIKEAFSVAPCKEIKAILIGPSVASDKYIQIIDFFKKDYPTESIIFFSRDKDAGKILLSNKSFKGHFILIQSAIDEAEKIIKEVLLRDMKFTQSFPEESDSDSLFIGTSKSIRQVKHLVYKYSKSADPVLVYGETGTGKEIIAQLIHSVSDRKNMIFHTINAGAITSELSVSEFFGATAGAYTGATNRTGMFEYADRGSLFIDEIAELHIQIQAELLRVLQDGSIRKIGSNKVKKVNFRLISATNKNLVEEIKEKRFRSDLFHRINTLEIFIPPLRERKEDIPDLLLHFCDELRNENIELDFSLSDSFIDKLFEYNWPGNVRELRNILRRAVFSSDTKLLSADSIIFSNF